jgi:uncharacterized protein YjiS (DUF1127 family)
MTYLGTRCLTAAAPVAGFGASPGILDRIWKWIRRPALIHGQRRQLDQLSDHMLKDIGLSRSEIDGISEFLIDGHADPTRRVRTKSNVNFREPSTCRS